MTTVLAVDLGAQSGRVGLARFDGERLSLTEVARFENRPVRVVDTLHWDVLRLWEGLTEGLARAASHAGGQVDSVGVDGWGVDFGLLDRAGRLVQNPIHHRDPRGLEGMRAAFERVPPRVLYERTGIQLLPINTVFQLAAMTAADDPALASAERLLMIPDLFHYWLSGSAACEFTNATTTQLLDPVAGDWAWELLETLELPRRLFPDVVRPGTLLGRLRAGADAPTLARTQVVAPASHDTASAVAAVPFSDPAAVFISAGTWSLVGIDVAGPIVTERTFAANLTNEGGVEGRFRLLANVTGLWILEECRRRWAASGEAVAIDELIALAEAAPPLRALIDPNDLSFLEPGDMPARIEAFTRRTGQPSPDGRGALARCVLESIALGHREALERIREATGITPPVIHLVGGGARNRLLCQWTANAAQRPVLAGPVEATLVGNALVQAIALGALDSIDDARAVVGRSFPLTAYEAGETEAWDDAYARFRALKREQPPSFEQAVAV